MFEVGKTYTFRMLDGEGEIEFTGEIERYDHPLIKLKDSEPLTIDVTGFGTDDVSNTYSVGSFPGRIINVTSPHFISAQAAK